MELNSLILQFGGSLVAILALFWLTRLMRLGGTPSLGSDEDVRTAAAEVADGFEAQRISIARGGRAALARDEAGRIMLIKLHGNRFAGRILTDRARVSEKVDLLEIDCGETGFGMVSLSLDDAAYWADAINRL